MSGVTLYRFRVHPAAEISPQAWLRLHLLIRELLAARWDAKTWPVVKAELGKALVLQRRLKRAAWWN